MALLQLNGQKISLNGKLQGTSLIILNSNETYVVQSSQTTVDFKYVGDVDTTGTIVLSGSNILVSNTNNNIIWDFGGVEEYNFGAVDTATIFRTIGGTVFKITFTRGSLFLKVENIGTTEMKMQFTTASINQSVILPHLSGYVYDYTVNWGDGNSNRVTSSGDTGATHIYSTIGTYTVSISGTCETIYFNGGGSNLLVTKVLQWGDIGLKQIRFNSCTNLNSIPNDIVGGLSKVITFDYTFNYCIKFERKSTCFKIKN